MEYYGMIRNVFLSGIAFGFLGWLAAGELSPYVPAPHEFQPAQTIPSSEVVIRDGDESIHPSGLIVERTLNGQWKFSGVMSAEKSFPADVDLASGFMNPGFDDTNWDTIPVPQSWFWKYPEARNQAKPHTRGLYRRSFELSGSDLEHRRVILKFGCVGYEAKVFLNGREIGNHHGDFTPFEIDATDAAKPGKNVLALRVLSSLGPTFGRREKISHVYGTQWSLNSYKAGIWQDVTLSLEPELRIQKLFVNPRLSDNSVGVNYTIVNHSGRTFRGTLDGIVTGAMKENANAPAGKMSVPVELKPGINTGSIRIRLKNPQLWSVDRPSLYYANLLLRENGRIVSAANTRFGFREFRTKDGRFYLNGEEIYLFGENIPSISYGGSPRAAAADRRLITEYLLTMRNFGYNIIRTSHQPVIPAVLEAADECGMMIFHEWGWSFNTEINEKEFQKNNLEEIAEFVEASYNHPCVTMWSLGNEIPHGNRPEIARQLDLQVQRVRALDGQKRPVSTFSGSAGWQSYGRTKLDTDVHDLHTYVSLARPWTERNEEADFIYKGLLEIYGEKKRLSRPLVAWENVGFSWGFLYSSNKNPEFKRNSPEEYLRYVDGETSWADPRGIGYTGCMSLAEAVDPKVSDLVPMTRFGKRIFELYRLDRRFSGFAPWFGKTGLKTATLWTQPVLPVIRNEEYLFPRNLYAGESSSWTLEIANDSNRDYRNLRLALTLADASGEILPVSEVTIAELPKHRNTAQPLTLAIPAVDPGFRQLRLTLFDGKTEIARNYYNLRLASPAIRTDAITPKRNVYIYDTGASKNVAQLRKLLDSFRIPCQMTRDFSGLKQPATVIVPAESEQKQKLALRGNSGIKLFLNDGGILLVLEQRNVYSTAPASSQLVEQPVAFCDPIVLTHPVFEGLTARDFDSWNNSERGYVLQLNYMPFTVNALAAKGTMLGRKEVGMGLVEAATDGDGRLILSQLLATTSAPQDSSAMLYLRNLISYAVGAKERWKEARPLSKMEESFFSILPERMESIDLAPWATHSFSDERDGDRQGGWTDQGVNDFRMMPTGKVMEADNIPFEIIDPAKNGGKSCIVLAGTERPYFPLAVKGIKVDGMFNRLFFLHTAAWGDSPNAGRYRIHYADGSSIDIPLIGKRNIGDWWNASPLPEARPGIYRKNPDGRNVGTFVMAWNNPRPQTAITAIDFLSPLYRDKAGIDWAPTATAVPVLIAISGEKAHPNPVEITGKAYKRLLPACETGSKLQGKVQEKQNHGRREWNILFPASPAGEIPAAFFQFNPAGLSEQYDLLTLTIRSRNDGAVELRLPQKDWRGYYLGTLQLTGDNKPRTYRLRVGRELTRSAAFTFRDLRGELFFFHRSGDSGSRPRPVLNFTVEAITLE